MEKYRCLICKNNDIKKVKFIKIISRYTDKSYPIYKCNYCGLIRPLPSSIKDMLSVQIYDTPENIRFYNKDLKIIDKETPEYKLYFEYFVIYKDFIKKYHITGRGLDIGCGAGHLIKLLSKQGIKMEGMDISPVLVGALKKEKIKAYCGDLGKGIIKKKYDLITLNQVLEHIDNAEKFLFNVRKILKEEGYIIFAVPYLYGLIPQILRSYWYGLGYGQHFNFFSKKSLSLLLNKAGFEVCEFKLLICDYTHPKFPRILNFFIRFVMQLLVKLNFGDNLFVVARLNKT